MDERWNEVKAIWQDNRWLYALVGVFVGLMLYPVLASLRADFAALLQALVPHAISGAVIVFLVVRLVRADQTNDTESLRTRLLQQVAGKSNYLAMRGIDDMRTHGWLSGEAGVLAGANLSGADLHDIDLSDVNLERAQLGSADLHGVNFSGANLRRVEMFNVQMRGAVLMGANLTDANLFSSKMKRSTFRRAEMARADMSYTVLESSDFVDANLQDTKMLSAMLRGVDFSRAQLGGANFTNADIMNADFSGATFSEATVLPDGTAWSSTDDIARFTDSTHPLFWRSTSKLSPAYHDQSTPKVVPTKQPTAGLGLDFRPNKRSID